MRQSEPDAVFDDAGGSQVFWRQRVFSIVLNGSKRDYAYHKIGWVESSVKAKWSNAETDWRCSERGEVRWYSLCCAAYE